MLKFINEFAQPTDMQERDEKIVFDGIDDTVPSDEDIPSTSLKRWKCSYGLGWFAPRFFPRTLTEDEIHEISLGKIKPLRCKKCNFYFTSRSELMRHIWKHRKNISVGIPLTSCI
jgi:hypothetical protein